MPGAVVFSYLFFFLFALESWAVQLTIKRPPLAATGTDANNNLINSNNLRYSTNISIGGNVVNVLIDTGSTDLWVMPPSGLKAFNDTGLSTTLRYGDGSNFVTGDIGVGAFELDGGQFTVPLQAYLQGVQEAGEAADFAAGHFGILGLGFDSPGASRINTAVQQAKGATATWGQSVLSNIFAQNPSGSDYIGISLSRTGDQEGTADGSLTISEYDTDYASVQNSPKLSQTPPNSGVWSIVMDAFSVGGKKIQWPSTMTAAPAGKNIVLLDTGTTNILMPEAQVDAIYSSISGAVLAPNSRTIPLVQFSASNNVWVVPCTAQVDVVATFSGQDFAIHPLDVTDMQVLTSPDGSRNFTVCTNAFTDIGTIAQGETDALFGDSFLRNVYSALDFGTGGPTKGTPFVQLLSNTDATKSAADLINVRRTTMATMPPELSPSDFIKVFNGELSAADAVPVTTSAFTLPATSTSASASSPTPPGGSSSSSGSSSGSGSGSGSSDGASGGSTPVDTGKKSSGTLFGPRMSIAGLAMLLVVTSLL